MAPRKPPDECFDRTIYNDLSTPLDCCRFVSFVNDYIVYLRQTQSEPASDEDMFEARSFLSFLDTEKSWKLAYRAFPERSPLPIEIIRDKSPLALVLRRIEHKLQPCEVEPRMSCIPEYEARLVWTQLVRKVEYVALAAEATEDIPNLIPTLLNLQQTVWSDYWRDHPKSPHTERQRKGKDGGTEQPPAQVHQTKSKNPLPKTAPKQEAARRSKKRTAKSKSADASDTSSSRDKAGDRGHKVAAPTKAKNTRRDRTSTTQRRSRKSSFISSEDEAEDGSEKDFQISDEDTDQDRNVIQDEDGDEAEDDYFDSEEDEDCEVLEF